MSKVIFFVHSLENNVDIDCTRHDDQPVARNYWRYWKGKNMQTYTDTSN